VVRRVEQGRLAPGWKRVSASPARVRLVKVSSRGQQVEVYASVAYITGPLVQAEVHTSSVGEPVTRSLMRLLAAGVAIRVAKG